MRRQAKATSAIAAICGVLLATVGATGAFAASEVLTWFGAETGTGALGGQFNNPRDSAVNETGAGPANPGDTYVVDETNNRIQRFDKAGNFISAWGADVDATPSGGTNYEICTIAAACKAGVSSGGNGTVAGNGALALPQSVAVDNDTGNVYVSERTNRRISVYDGEGNFIRAFGFDVNTTVNEVQSLTVKATAGQFKLTFNSQTTNDIDAATATSAIVQAELNALSSIAPGAVTVTGGPANAEGTSPFVVTFSSGAGIAATDVAQITATAGTTPLSGGSGTGANTVSITTTQPGVPASTAYEICQSTNVCKAAAASGAGVGQIGNSITAATLGIAVSPADTNPATGKVFLADSQNRRVNTYELDGTSPASFGSSATFASTQPRKVAVDSRGIVYVSNNVTSNGTPIERYDSQGVNGPVGFLAPIFAANSTPTPGPLLAGGIAATAGLAISPDTDGAGADTDVLYVLRDPTTGPTVVQQLGPLNQPGQSTAPTAADETHGAGAGFEAVTGLSLNDTEGRLLISSATLASAHRVWMLGTPAQPPAVTISAPTSVTGTTATFQGTVKTDKIGAGYHFEYSPDGSTWTKVPAIDTALPGDSAIHAVSAPVSGLNAKTTYQVKLVATKNLGGGTASAQTSFETSGASPSVGEISSSRVSDTAATLHGAVNAQNEASKYRFEYITEEHFEEEGFFGADSSPLPAGSLPSGSSPVAVETTISGLSPATDYRYRLTAFNGAGTSHGEAGTFTTYSAPDDFSGQCSVNEALRSGPSANLPDCRAYEQASPIDKGGASVQGTTAGGSIQASPDGTAISYDNAAGLPGGVGSQIFPSYVAKRGADSWASQGLLPDPSVGINASVIGWTPDFSLAFARAGSLVQGFGLFARSTAGEPLTEIAPYTSPDPNYTYIGASADASTAVFGAQTAIDSEGAAGKPNLYAWDRETGELHLAGILPDGSIPAGGTRAGTSNTYNQDMNAVGEDGSTVFTDRGDGKLYLRLNPTAPETTSKDIDGNCEPDPVLACTVAISASQKKNGKGPEGHDAAGTAPATLRFASPDGSKVIFTSSEKLTDDANTGPEPDAPAIAKAKASDGTEKDLDFIPTFADQIDIDPVAGYVYWTDPAHDKIGRAKLDGSVIEESLITDIANLKGIAVVHEPGEEHVFWTTPAAGEDTEVHSNESEFTITGQGTIGRADLDGGNPEPSCLEGIVNPFRIDANAEHLYWTSPGRTIGDRSGGNGKVSSADLDCDEGSLVQPFISGVGEVASGDITVNGSHIYFSAFSVGFKTSYVIRFDLDGTNRMAITQVTDTSQAAGLALDSSHLYWTDPGPSHNRIGRSDLDGANPQVSFITEAGNPSDLAVDATNVYWTTNQSVNANPGNDLYEFDLESGELTDLAVDSGAVNGIEAQGVLGASEDGDYVYFVANGVPDELSGSPNANGEEATPGNCKGGVGVEDWLSASGTCNLYLAHGGEVAFIARLTAAQLGEEQASNDSANWVDAFVGKLFEGEGKSARVSEDGGTLLFRSYRRLTDYDNEGPTCKAQISPNPGSGGLFLDKPGPCLEYYLYRAGESELACVSCVPTGATPTLQARLSSLRPPTFGAPRTAQFLPRNLSEDGQRIFFESADQLVAADTNGYDGCPRWGGEEKQQARIRACQDVYEWEAPGKGSCTESSNAYSPSNDGCIYLISTGKSDEASFFGDASENGDDVFVFTYEQLVPQDEDGLMDVYDARAGGGLASQHQVAAVPCEGEACKGAAVSQPASSSAGSSSFAGPGDQAVQRKPPRTRCPQGKRKVRRNGKPRCVREGRQHKRNHRRAADANGRAGR